MSRALSFLRNVALSALSFCALASLVLPSVSPAHANSLPSVVASDSNFRCAANHATSVAIPFQVVDLGLAAERTAWLGYFHGGPRVRAVVIDSTKWPEVWRAAADTVPMPPVVFGSDALMLLATRGYHFGPSTLIVKWIRRCRRTGTIVVASLQDRVMSGGTDSPSRGMTLVRVPRRELDGARVVFRDLPPK